MILALSPAVANADDELAGNATYHDAVLINPLGITTGALLGHAQIEIEQQHVFIPHLGIDFRPGFVVLNHDDTEGFGLTFSVGPRLLLGDDLQGWYLQPYGTIMWLGGQNNPETTITGGGWGVGSDVGHAWVAADWLAINLGLGVTYIDYFDEFETLSPRVLVTTQLSFGYGW